MNKNQRKKTNKKMQNSLSRVHLLIAVVAIIECLVLISFTTYSWIESASSLVIMNGPQSTTTTDNVNIDIADKLSYNINLDSDAGNAPLDEFFSHTKYYRYGKASSCDGKVLYFPKKNNTYTGATTFRRGDTTDYNTSYAYFDFNIINNVGNKDFYFNDDTTEKQDIFRVSDTTGYFENKNYTINEGGTNQTYNKTEAIRRAMRISIVATNTLGETNEVICSPTGKQWTAQNGTNFGSTANAYARKITDFGLNSHSGNDKLFTSKKNKDTRVQIRIWFEMNDKDFVTAFGNGTTADITTDDYKAIAGVKIAINLSLGNADNNFLPFYFDDYTFSNTSGNVGGNVTLDNSNYKVWFHCSNPDNPSSFQDYEMTREETSGGRTRWSCDTISQTLTDYLSETISSTYLTQCYFAYGPSVGNPTYTWALNQMPTIGTTEFIYNAYSRYKVNNDYIGSGCWNDRSTVRLIQFKDYTTMLVSDAFNRSSSNFQIIKQNPEQHLFINNYSSYSTATAYSQNTAAMFYDSTNEVFKSYVPYSWMSSNVYFRFNLGTEGYYGVDLGFIGSTPALSNGTDYIYTALGQDENRTLAYYNQSNTGINTNRICSGFGTWGGIEQIHLNAELIDYDIKATDRFKVSVAGGDFDSTAAQSIPMIPDATGMVYSAYVPAGSGVNTTPYLKFARVEKTNNDANNFTTVNARWYTDLRGSSDTYYPVKITNATNSSDLSRGYWNLSVLVDGTYENLIYDTLTDGDGEGRLEYSFDGTTYVTFMEDSSTAGTPTTDNNRIDAYRWYVSCSAGATVYYRWTPYYGDDDVFGGSDDTTFVFTHNTSSGLYCVITEPEDAVTIAQNTPSEQRRSLNALAGTGFDVNVEQSISEQSDTNESAPQPTLISDLFAADLLAAENETSSQEVQSLTEDQGE